MNLQKSFPRIALLKACEKKLDCKDYKLKLRAYLVIYPSCDSRGRFTSMPDQSLQGHHYNAACSHDPLILRINLTKNRFLTYINIFRSTEGSHLPNVHICEYESWRGNVTEKDLIRTPPNSIISITIGEAKSFQSDLNFQT